MTVKVFSVGLRGLEGYRVQVQVQIFKATESMVIVGLPDTSVKESKERVLSAIRTLGCDVTDQKIVVNLSPSEQKKNGPFFDLAMAIGLLKEAGELKEKIPEDTMFIGALALDGTVEKVEGMLPALIAARYLGFKMVYLPYDPLLPLEMLEGLECIVVEHITDVLHHLAGQGLLPFHVSTPRIEIAEQNEEHQRDFCHIIGHEQPKQALEIAAAGEHNLLLSGPPGCGKSLLAESLASILPPLTSEAKLEVISLFQLAKEKLVSISTPPYRNPHHSASSVAIIGGGSYPRPGEISLAHRGVLFLDEMPEFPKKTLEMLRQPLETGKITICRAQSTVSYPAQFILIAAMNPCPCGYRGSNAHYCTCTPNQIQSYQSRISGPLYDRIDILLSLNSVDLDQSRQTQQTSADFRLRVEKARERQYERYQEQICNANIPYEKLMMTSNVSEHQKRMIKQMSSKQQWSNRVQIKIIRLARTISDLEGSIGITDESIWKAMTLRRLNPHKEQHQAGKR